MLAGVDGFLTIGEFSQRSGLSARRLRSYAAADILVPAAVDAASGYRYYLPRQVRDAQLIDALRAAGVSVAGVADVLRDRSPAQLDSWAGRIRADAASRDAALARARKLLAPDPSSPHFDEPSRRSAMTTLHTTARSDTGPVRPSNQDAVLAGDRLVAVADGMGGPPAGEQASALVLAVLDSAFAGGSGDELAAGVRAANRAVFERARADADLEGMGTTLCAVGLLADGALVVANVGDSRAYLWRDGRLRRLTEDHSVVGELVRRGELTESEARRHPHRSVLTRAVGVAPSVEVDASVEDVAPGDRILLCTDGLVNEV